MANVESVLRLAMSQLGKPYIFGALPQSTDPDPAAFDCSSLVKWCCDRSQVAPRMPPLTYYQYLHCATHGTLIDVDQAVRTRGALLFVHRDRNGNPKMPADPVDPSQFGSAHVAFSLGDGRTVEAANQVLDVCIRSSAGRGFTAAATIPGIGASSGTMPAAGDFPAPMQGKPYLQLGSTGPGVVEMQQLLINLGVSAELAAAGATGNFREKTDRAVRAFQQMVRSRSGDARMAVDGECGPVTWAWLHKLAG